MADGVCSGKPARAGRGSGRRVCLFAMYDPGNRIGPMVAEYVAAIGRSGFRVVVAVSGTRLPPARDLARLEAAGADWLFRPNEGHDFGAWRDLARAGHAEGAEWVLLANDSVFGPFGDLSAIVDRMCRKRLDVWGLVESGQHGWHLQSWFLCFSAAAFARPAIRRVLDQPFERMTKLDIIVEAELALGAAIRTERFRARGSWRRRHSAVPAWVWPQNPMHLEWRSMLRSGRVPFLKAELLRDNPMNLPFVDEWRGVLRRGDREAIEPIERALFEYGDAKWRTGEPFPTPFRWVRLRVWLKYLALGRDRWTMLRMVRRGSLIAARRWLEWLLDPAGAIEAEHMRAAHQPRPRRRHAGAGTGGGGGPGD